MELDKAICVFCFTMIEDSESCRRLPCSHYSCVSCLRKERRQCGKVLCARCRYVYDLGEPHNCTHWYWNNLIYHWHLFWYHYLWSGNIFSSSPLYSTSHDMPSPSHCKIRSPIPLEAQQCDCCSGEERGLSVEYCIECQKNLCAKKLKVSGCSFSSWVLTSSTLKTLLKTLLIYAYLYFLVPSWLLWRST